MSAPNSDSERRLYAQRVAFKLGPLETHFEQPRFSGKGQNQNVTHLVKDPDVGSVVEPLTPEPESATVDGIGFSDEIRQLILMRKTNDPVPVRHWMADLGIAFQTDVVIDSLDYESHPGMGSDGSGEWRALSYYTIGFTETSI